MRVIVRLMRRKGRLVRDSEDEAPYTFDGEVRTAVIFIKDVPYKYASMRTGLPADDTKRMPPDLYEPVLTGIGQDAIILRGFEGADGTGHVQEWYIQPRSW